MKKNLIYKNNLSCMDDVKNFVLEAGSFVYGTPFTLRCRHCRDSQPQSERIQRL